MPTIRRGEAGDLKQVAAIQAACPEAADWDVADYLKYEFLVAVEGLGIAGLATVIAGPATVIAGPATVIAGFLVWRTVAQDEREILNLAVAPEFRRKQVARSLLENLLKDFRGAVYLEVRESNAAGIKFYNSMEFKVFSCRKKYYAEPLDAAIVMKFHSC